MARLCCVRYCDNGDQQRLDPEVTLFHFPRVKKNQGPQSEELSRRQRKAWVSAVRRPGVTFSKDSPLFVCSRHFHTGQPAHETLDTDPDWAPSLQLGRQKAATKSTVQKNTGVMAPKSRRVPRMPVIMKNECCVLNCGGRSHNDRGQRIRNGLTFYSFPIWRKNNGVFLSNLSKRRREAWLKAVGRDDFILENIPDTAHVCSRHFLSGKPTHDMMEKDPDWVPSLHLNIKKTHVTKDQATVKEKKKRKREEKRRKTDTCTEDRSAPSEKNLGSDPQNSLNFEESFRNHLKASLEACLLPGPTSSSESRPLDPIWFSISEKSSRLLASPASETNCRNCVRLQMRITDLEERLVASQDLQDQADASNWTEPLSQTDLEQAEGEILPPQQPKARFHQDWLMRHWFLRYSPRLNMMWCHVCRLYGGTDHRCAAFVYGTRVFQNFTIVQHSKSSYHQECVKKYEAHKARVKH